MPFGKFRGYALSALPDDYLDWLLDLDNLRPRLRCALEDEAERRGLGDDRHRYADDGDDDRDDGYRSGRRSAPNGNRNVPALPVVEDVINAGRRALAARHHPDLPGGDGERMKLINSAADWLLGESRRLAL